MTPHELALWDISLIDHKMLTPASLEAMTTPVRLRNGTPTNYAWESESTTPMAIPACRTAERFPDSSA
ncbi:MAG TPA: hypothetical protein VME43_18435 [Bryobacteraceae bacterium]|nr:hypothetical protein [Bryobacteraceae bacterium]